jgi:hypothetical protein
LNLLKMNLWQGGFFKQARYLVSTPQRSQTVIFISETGTISKEVLPMYSGYITAAKVQSSWLVDHALKLSVKNKQGGFEDGQVLAVSERSFLPLDPFNRTNGAKVTPLTDIAKLRHTEKRSNISEGANEDARTRLIHAATVGGLVIIALEVLLKIWRG